MRIATSTIFEAGTRQLGTLQTDMAKLQMQMSTNRRVVTPSDDPIAAARALEVTQSQSLNTQLATNRSNARSSLSQEEVVLNSVTGLIQDVQDLVVSSGNASFTDSDRASKATELEGRLADLLGLANSTDGNGGYMFSGYKSATQPFNQTATGADYAGDQGQRQVQIGSTRSVPISDSGTGVFENNPTGNGKFQTSSAATNTGAGIISSGTVTDVSQFTGHKYALDFKVVAGTPDVTTYNITDNSTTPPSALQIDQPYKAGQSITFGGMSMDVKGVPANGDSFTVAPSQKQSIFTTLTTLIGTLRAGATGSAGKAALTNGLSQASDNLKSALDTVLTARSTIGSRMNELDSLDSTGTDLGIQYASTLSDLTDLDLVAAYSAFSQQQLTLTAAQKSFTTMTGLSLFNYISG
jgi:flagellar hook-associated protein 3 FlgL